MVNYLMQMVMGCAGSVGFAVLFNVPVAKLMPIALASALSWIGYALCMMFGGGAFWALFIGTAIAALISELLARILKTPVLMLLVPILIPLIPGGDLYHMMNALVRGQDENMLRYARLVLTEAGSIALGIICVSSVTSIFYGLLRRADHKKGKGS